MRIRLSAVMIVAVVGVGVLSALSGTATAVAPPVCGDVAAPHGLDAAIVAANAAAGEQTINLLPCTYFVDTPADPSDPTGPTGLPEITGKVTINGNLAQIVRVTSAPDFRIFHVVGDGASLTLRYVTVAGGYFSDNHLGAGVLVVNGSLVMEHAALLNNVSNGGGGAIGIPPGGSATIINSVLQGNQAPGANDGGAIASGGSVNIRGSAIVGNSTGGLGAGVESFGEMTIVGSTFSDNRAYGAAAIFDQSSMAVTNTSFLGNVATSADGGAISLQAGGTQATLTRVTIKGNRAAATGGGIYVGSGSTATVTRSFVEYNTAGTDGGGIRLRPGATITLQKTVVSHNAPDNCAPLNAVAGCAN